MSSTKGTFSEASNKKKEKWWISLLLDYESNQKTAIGKMLMSRFVIKSLIDKCRSSELRRKLLIKGTDLTLAKLQEIARSFEAVDIQLKAMCGEEQQVNRVYHKETADQYKRERERQVLPV